MKVDDAAGTGDVAEFLGQLKQREVALDTVSPSGHRVLLVQIDCVETSICQKTRRPLSRRRAGGRATLDSHRVSENCGASSYGGDVTPAESDFLLRLTALALSFVGFSSIVVSLRFALGGKLSDRHVRLVRLYIEGGLVVTALGVVPPLLNLLHVPEAMTWRVSSAAAAAIFTLMLITQFRRRRAVEGHFPGWVVMIFVISVLFVLGLWINVVGVPVPPSVGPYAAVLVWTLSVCGFTFVRTLEIFLHREPPA